MKILAFDPANSCGFAFWDGVAVSQTGYHTFVKTPIDGDRLLEVFRWTKEQIDLWKPDLVLAEGFFASGRFANGVEVNFGIRAAIMMACAQYEKMHLVYTPTEWKRKLLGRTNPTKAEKKRWGKAKAKKEITVQKLRELGCPIPKKVTSEKGNQVNFRYDCSDALGILVAHLQINNETIAFHPDLFKVETAK